MQNHLTEIGFILDYNDSMAGLEKTLFVITTDGLENASWKYTYEKVR